MNRRKFLPTLLGAATLCAFPALAQTSSAWVNKPVRS